MVSPFEQGEARGRAEKRAIQHALQELKRAADFFDLEEGGMAKVEKESLKHIPGRYVEECEGLARGSDLGEDPILALNFGKGLSRLFADGCTSFVVPRAHTPDGSVLLLKNRDLPYRRMHPQVCAYSRLDGYNEFLGVVSGGNVNWYQGVNEKGLVAFNNAARGDPYEEGMPISVLLRRILEECDSVDGALRFIGNNAYNAFSNVFLADKERAVVVEVKSGYPLHIWEIEKPDCRANHYLFHANPDADTKEEALRRLQTLTRYERGRQLLKGMEKVSVEELQRFSRDHEQGPGSCSICRHAAFVGTPVEKLMSSSTLSAQIFRVGDAIETYVALGRPCQTEFVKLKYGQGIPEPLATGEAWLENLKQKED